jgi:hypothetical protein
MMYRPRVEGPSRANTIADEDIRAAIEDYDPMLTTAQAFVVQIREHLQAGRGWSFSQPKTVYPYIEAAQLPRKPEIEQALQAAWTGSNFARCIAYENAILDEAVAIGAGVDLNSSQLFLNIIQRLGQENNWARNSKGAAEQSAADEETTRRRLIASITQGKNVFQIFSKSHGQPRTFPASNLEGLSLEQLREIDVAAAELRRARGLSREEQRAELRERATEARGHEIFRPGDKTQLDGEIRYKDDGTGRNTFEFVDGSGPQSRPAAGAMDRSVPVAESTKPLWIDPSTGNYYSPIAIRKLFTTNPNLIRTMMKTNLAFTNRLLNAGN